jgi:hypothetical protein
VWKNREVKTGKSENSISVKSQLILMPIAGIDRIMLTHTRGIKESTGCELVARKCRMYSLDEGAWKDCIARGFIP